MKMKYGNVTRGQEEAFLNKIGGEHGLNQFLAGNLEVRTARHQIDCDADPFVPRNLKLVSHKKGGIITVVPSFIKLFCTEAQKIWGGQRGDVLRTEIEPYVGVMNANVLDHFLADTAAIPGEWKIQTHPGYKMIICFHGTMYEDSSCCNRKCVRTLSWSDFTGSWESGVSYVDMFFHVFTPTAMLPN